MIIECKACQARFRLDESKIKGKGARVKCRRCGELILVLLDEPAQAGPGPSSQPGDNLLDLRSVIGESLGAAVPPPPAAAPPAPPPPSSAAETSPAKDEIDVAFERFLSTPEERAAEPQAAAPEAGSVTSPAPGFEFVPEERILLPPETVEQFRKPAGEDAPLELAHAGDSLRGGVAKPPSVEPPEAPHPVSPPSVEEPTLRAETMEEQLSDLRESTRTEDAADALRTETVPPDGKPAPPPAPMARRPDRFVVGRPVALLILLFLALAGAGGYLGFSKSGQETLRGLIPGMESLWTRGGGQPHYDLRNLIGYYEPASAAGKMFIIKGQVANTGRASKSAIRVQAALLNDKEQVLAEKTAFAGNVLSGDALRQASRAKIEEAMGNQLGERFANIDVAPGKTLPFMVVFFDAPDGVSAYRLMAKDTE